MEAFTEQLWEASEKKRKCRIRLKGEFLPRVIHPYGICQTPANHIVLVCWQEMGFTRAGATAGYRNLRLADVEEIETLETHFSKRDDFNPLDGQYKDWVFHI
jgi:hypothetical protein